MKTINHYKHCLFAESRASDQNFLMVNTVNGYQSKCSPQFFQSLVIGQKSQKNNG